MEPISEFKLKIILNFKFNGVVLEGKKVNLNELKYGFYVVSLIIFNYYGNVVSDNFNPHKK